MSTVSACLVVRNEEAVLERCLRSLAGVVDEIVLVHDGPCGDRTLEIAERHGCRVVVADLAGQSEAHRPRGYELATGDWILRIDADEFLSDELRAAIPRLVAEAGVDGWAFLWPIWRHAEGRYVTRGGPDKLVLARRSACIALGIPHSSLRVRGRSERHPLVLEHRPLHDNYCRQTFLTKWRRRARIHARMYLTPWEQVPKFGYDTDSGWRATRVWGNRLSPLLIVPYGVVDFCVHLRRLRRLRPLAQIVRIAAYYAAYAMLVQVYVVKYRYLGKTAPACASA